VIIDEVTLHMLAFRKKGDLNYFLGFSFASAHIFAFSP